MHFPIEPPWTYLLELATQACVFWLGMRFERWRRARHMSGAAVRARARHAWDNWTKHDVELELRASQDLLESTTSNDSHEGNP